jgi:hypothetical protein
MERILAKVDSFQGKMGASQGIMARLEAKTDVNLKEMKQGIRTNRGKAEAYHEMIMDKWTSSYRK